MRLFEIQDFIYEPHSLIVLIMRFLHFLKKIVNRSQKVLRNASQVQRKNLK